jgi:phosphoglycolate phosphatase
MQQITGILFDKDGTLFDFQATWGAWAQSFLLEIAAGDRARAAELGTAIGYRFEAELFEADSPVIAGTPDEMAGLLLPLMPGIRPAELVATMNAAAARAPMREATPLAPLMERLSAMGLKLGVATNDAEAPARAHLSAAGVEAHFDFIAGCDSGFGAKPAPGQLLAFAEATGLAPEAVLMVGDSRHDLAAGRAAGMGTVAVLSGPARAEQLSDLADVILPDIGHLPGYLSARGR